MSKLLCEMGVLKSWSGSRYFRRVRQSGFRWILSKVKGFVRRSSGCKLHLWNIDQTSGSELMAPIALKHSVAFQTTTARFLFDTSPEYCEWRAPPHGTLLPKVRP